MKYLFPIFFSLISNVLFGQKTAVVLTGKELFGDMQARQIGAAIMSGRIIDLEQHPTNDRVIYVGSAGGGVWKSTNGGAAFQPIFDNHT